MSHIPPPTNFLLASKQLCGEVRDVYYRKTVFTIERAVDTFSPWAVLRAEETFAQGMGRAVLERMRRVDVNVFWHWLPAPGDMPAPGATPALAGMGVGGDGVVLCPREIEVRNRIESMRRLVNVLVKARELCVLCVNWLECTRVREDEWDFEWDLEARRRVLEPLKLLRGLRVVEADVVAGDEVEEVIEGFLGEVNRDMKERKEEVEVK